MKWLLVLLVFSGCKGGSKSGKVLEGNVSQGQADPLSSYQWHIHNTGQSNFSSSGGTANFDVNLGSVHDTYKGKGVKVVVSDSRVDVYHEDLSANTDRVNWRNYNSSSPYIGNPTTSDNTDAHGTAVMSIVGAEKDNGRGGYGIAPKATLIGTNFIESDQVVSKMVDQANIANAKVYNYSWGSVTCDVTPARDSFLEMIRFNTLNNDTVYVTAAGNDRSGNAAYCGGGPYYSGNGNLDQWKSYPYSIVVAASNSYGNVSSYSTPSSNLWITAPGGDTMGIGVPAADLQGCSNGYAINSSWNDFDSNSNGLNKNCNYVMETTVGTSFASPIVTGAVALLKEANPGLSWRDIKHILASTAVKLNPSYASWVTNGAGYTHSYQHGFGQINIQAAIELAKNKNFNLYNLKQTIKDFSGESIYQSGSLNLAIPNMNFTGISSTIDIQEHNLFIEHVQLKLSLSHASAQDISISLISPSNKEVKVLFAGSHIVTTSFTNITLGVSGFYGERSRGNWILKVKDEQGSNTGTLLDWSIKIIGNKGSLSDTTAPDPVSSVTNNGNLIEWVPSSSLDIARYEACVVMDSNSVATCNDQDWISLGNATTHSFTHENGDLNNPLVSSENYTVHIRAVDTSENESLVESYSWTAL